MGDRLSDATDLFTRAVRVDYLTLQSESALAERGVMFNLTKHTFANIAEAEAAVLRECAERGEVLSTLSVVYVTRINSNPCDCGKGG